MAINSRYALMDRRSFIAGAGSLFLSTLNGQAAENLDKSELLFASCIKRRDGRFNAVILNGDADLIAEVALPDRGHAVVFDANSNRAVAFARRPGNFALVFSVDGYEPPRNIVAEEGRHFYGHGVFSPKGDLLFASENDFETSTGKIGIYDATNQFKRLGEFDSFGIGPHEILLLNDGKTLAIANGGIETHPDLGRAKLNLSTMKPSLAFVDINTGDLIEKHTLDLNRLSIRHLAATHSGGVIFGCQFQGSKSDTPPLVGRCDLGKGINLWPLTADKSFANYTGSLATSKDGTHVAVSSPKGSVVKIFKTENGQAVKTFKMAGSAGVARIGGGFIASSERGMVKAIGDNKPDRQMPFLFDNHLTRMVR